MTEQVLHERVGRVAVITLNRPEKLNAWTSTMGDQYVAAVRAAENDPDVGAIVVTGAGRAFCSGTDLSDLGWVTHAAAEGRREEVREIIDRWTGPAVVRKPLIAAVNGAAVGIGFVQALYADIRFAHPGAQLGTAFPRLGLTAEYGSAWLLPRIVGEGRARDLLLSGRLVTGTEAHAMGLVNRLVAEDEVLDAAVVYANDLAENCSQTSMAVIKEQLDAAASSTFTVAADRASNEMLRAVTRPDAAEGVDAQRAGRQARFAREIQN